MGIGKSDVGRENDTNGLAERRRRRVHKLPR
jgi:hypothetical protein